VIPENITIGTKVGELHVGVGTVSSGQNIECVLRPDLPYMPFNVTFVGQACQLFLNNSVDRDVVDLYQITVIVRVANSTLGSRLAQAVK